ncbi:hypothetical protein [Actinoplanes sp. TFC3]|uniref:hypothetical protein n=1 Tax=Actinoplanes sp. TFC3 TaxID=1710355 RepID=UPI000830B1AD|nr:hypothetical protein [Actinoplanes sp. TFC3]
MAFRTWAKVFFATLGIGALTGAGELGLAYGLGIVRLTRVVDITARDQWTAQLAWVAWFPMVAAVVGAVFGARLLRRWAPTARGGVGTELMLSFAAAIGAAVVVPLTMQPARTAQIAGVDAVVVIAICSGLGAFIGVFAAWGALTQAVARWSLTAVSIAAGVLAVVSVAPSLAPSDPLPAVRLGVLDTTLLSTSVTQRTALATMPALALLAGALVGWVARRRDLPMLTIALAGLPGPALLTISYLIAGPGAGADRYQMTPYWAAMTATGAGVLGSVLAAVLRRPPVGEEAAATPEPAVAAERPAENSVALGEYTKDEPKPYDGFSRGNEPKRGYEPQPGVNAPKRESTPPYVPEPAVRPLPPEVVQHAAAHAPVESAPPARPPAGRPAANQAPAVTRAPASDRTPTPAPFTPGPLVPEPTPISAPLPQPQPSTPLPQTTSASSPRAATAPPRVSPPIDPGGTASWSSPPVDPAGTTPRLSRPIAPPVTDPATILPEQGGSKSRFGLRKRKDEDYVDWVSGLGNQQTK